jgi:hypothetical protein
VPDLIEEGRLPSLQHTDLVCNQLSEPLRGQGPGMTPSSQGLNGCGPHASVLGRQTGGEQCGTQPTKHVT